MNFENVVFNSHKNHNPDYDILEGHLSNGIFITYHVNIHDGSEGMEYYAGENYGGLGKSYSRNFSSDNIPTKYKPYWEKLRQIYMDKYKTNDVSGLSENYKRLFGDIPESDQLDRRVKITEGAEKNKLTPEQMTKWVNLHRKFTTNYPNKSLVMKEGKIFLDNFLVESANAFLDKDMHGMVESLRIVHRKLQG